MRYQWRNNAVVCIHNLAADPQEVRFSLPAIDIDDSNLINLLTDEHSHPEKGRRHCILLEPYGYRWFRVGGLDYLLKRSDN